MNTLDDLPPATLAAALEERGFSSMWFGEHSHIPVRRETPYPAGGEMPPQYRQMMDPLLSLVVAAGATATLRIGTGVALPLEHDLFAFAKAVATLDQLSRGRAELGVGVGWNREELADHRPDIPWPSRYNALAECVAALRALWSCDGSEYHGRWFEFEPVWSEPKPLQQPHPPILCGMAGPRGAQEAVAWGDEWMPIDVALGDVARRVATFRRLANSNGRDIPITLVTWGDPSADVLRGYRDLGIRRVVLGAARQQWDEPETTLTFIDRYAALVDELR